MTLRIGVLPLARPTFDVPYAQEMAAKAYATLDASGHAVVGGCDPPVRRRRHRGGAGCSRGGEARPAAHPAGDVHRRDHDGEDRAGRDGPARLWAFPEPRAGGRLRLNAFCGLNLAMHALGLAGKPAGWLYAAPDAPDAAASIADMAAPARTPASAARPAGATDAAAAAKAEAALAALQGGRIGLVGEHPAGFDTCRYDAGELKSTCRHVREAIPLTRVFETAKAADGGAVAAARDAVSARVLGLSGWTRSSSIALCASTRRSRASPPRPASRAWPCGAGRRCSPSMAVPPAARWA